MRTELKISNFPEEPLKLGREIQISTHNFVSCSSNRYSMQCYYAHTKPKVVIEKFIKLLKCSNYVITFIIIFQDER